MLEMSPFFTHSSDSNDRFEQKTFPECASSIDNLRTYLRKFLFVDIFCLMSMVTFPSPIMSINSPDLFNVVRYHCGEEAVDLMLAQKINDIQTLLRVDDIFALVHLPTDDYRYLKEKVAVELNDGTWSVLIGIQARVDNFINALRNQAFSEEQTHHASANSCLSLNDSTVFQELIHMNPSLNALFIHMTTINTFSNHYDLSTLITILNNICSNLTKTKNNYRYSDFIKHFALSLFIYAGQNAYRFVSMNIPAFLPSITTVKTILHDSSISILEVQFRFDEMSTYFTSHASSFAFAAEDTTGVIVKVVYDTKSNSFIGFNTPLDQGRPVTCRYKTNSYSELEQWFLKEQKSTLIYVHTLQPLSRDDSVRIPTPFLLSAYGVNGKFTSDDILNRWLWMYEEVKSRGVRILGFSSDCDPRYLRSMRMTSGFLVSDPDTRFKHHHDSFRIDIPQWTWFFMKKSQLCLFLQVSLGINLKK